MNKRVKKIIEKGLCGEHIHAFDIGAKDGVFSIPKLIDFIKFTGFEPNPHEFKNLKDEENISYLPFALAGEKGTRNFNVMKHASFSSFLEFDDVNFEKHFGRMKDYPIWKAGMQVDKVIQIETEKIDNLLTLCEVPSIDFIKLDTQGTELEILKGAKQALRDKKVGVIFAEVSFIKNYINQNLFSELDLFLRDQGYDFIDCKFYPDVVPQSNSKNYDSARYSVGGDAIFIPRIEDNKLSKKNLFKIGLIIAALGYYGIAIKYLKLSEVLTETEIKTLFNSLGKQNFKDISKSFIPPIFNLAIRKIRS